MHWHLYEYGSTANRKGGAGKPTFTPVKYLLRYAVLVRRRCARNWVPARRRVGTRRDLEWLSVGIPSEIKDSPHHWRGADCLPGYCLFLFLPAAYWEQAKVQEVKRPLYLVAAWMRRFFHELCGPGVQMSDTPPVLPLFFPYILKDCMQVIIELLRIIVMIFSNLFYNRVFPHYSHLVDSCGVQIVGGS
uniref:Uncharacterized protein n=1 Tax=Candidatus Kentrum sp. LPFa TaxID=2126335 RepID=A0A450VXC1_9GAMM|nr:MAG: hypothetical protein BECKLPF1236A_GA0070988_100242 [Candidatus Kentron sp. LPFa]